MIIEVIPGCMLYDLATEPTVIKQPESRYPQSPEYKCKRCGHSFSERYPTRMWPTPEGGCKFDG